MTTLSIRSDRHHAQPVEQSQKAGWAPGYVEQDLNAWVDRSGNAGQRVRRLDALEKIKSCFEDQSETLDFSNDGLTEAPPHFPPTAKTIDLSGNRLKIFSTPLHPGVEALNLRGNVLTEITTPMPDGMKRLNISYNRLTSVPACSPKLESLKAARNLFAALPDGFPSAVSTDFNSTNYARVDRPLALGNYAINAEERSKVLAKFRKPVEQKFEPSPVVHPRHETPRIEAPRAQAKAETGRVPEKVDISERTRKMLNAAIEGRHRNPELALQTLAKLLGIRVSDSQLPLMMHKVVSDWASTLQGKPINQPRKIQVFMELCSYLADPRTRHITEDYLRPAAIANVSGHGGKPPIIKMRPANPLIRAPSVLSVASTPSADAPHINQKMTVPAGFVMDARFGQFGYAKENPEFSQAYQLPLTKPGMDDAQRDTALDAVDLSDMGYAAHIEHADGRREPIMHGSDFTLPLPPVIPAQIVSLRQSGSRVDFVKFELSQFNPNDGTTVHNTHYLPFSTYQQPDGAVVGMVDYDDGSTPYCFSIDADNIPLAGNNTHVTLTHATQNQKDCMLQFQMNLHVESQNPCPILSSARQLKGEPIEVKAKFEQVFEHNRAVLERAMEAYRRFPTHVECTLAKLVGLRPGAPRLRSMLKTMVTGWESMRDSMAHLKSQSSHAIGFFDIKEEPTLTGQARNHSLASNVLLKHLKSPVMAFSRRLFMGPAPLGALASIFRHEWSHALLGTTDFMDPQNKLPVYPGEDQNFEKVYLDRFGKAAALPGSKPEQHASTFEIFTELCGLLGAPETKHLAMNYLKPGSDSYRRVERRPARPSAPITPASLKSLNRVG